MLSHCINTHEIMEERAKEAEEKIEEAEDEIEMMEEEEDRQTKEMAKEIVKENHSRILETQEEADAEQQPDFEGKMPKIFQSEGERLKVEQKTVQEKLKEKKEFDEEIEKENKELMGETDPEEEMSPQEEKTQAELELQIIESLKEAGDTAEGFNMTDPEIPNSFDFLEIDNDSFNRDCMEAFKTKKMQIIRERCLPYCHKYSLWYFSGSINRNVERL